MSKGLMPNIPGSVPPRRDGIDFWRGVMLCTIFINHVPGNIFESLTPKNFGFSDSAEAFVFLSGVSLALAYGHRFAKGDWRKGTASLMRRAGKLYGIHIVLSLAGLAIFGAGALLEDSANLLNQHGRGLFVEHPADALVGLVSLGHQLGYFNILPLYMMMLIMAPAMLWVGGANPLAMVGLSGLVYLGTRIEGWNLPNWPIKGSWFFDPFAWQFLLAIGIASGILSLRARIPRRRPLLILACMVLLYGAWSVTNGFSLFPGLQDWTRAWADLDKTTLGAGRLIHFMCIAYVLHALRVADGLRRFALFKPLCLIGRSSLWMFSLLSLLAALGQVAAQVFGHGVVLDGTVIGAGLMLLYRTAKRIDGTAHPPASAVAVRDGLGIKTLGQTEGSVLWPEPRIKAAA